jgi:hypothetical protein
VLFSLGMLLLIRMHQEPETQNHPKHQGGLYPWKLAFQIRETQVLQVRWEVFNVFNTTQFFGPEAVSGDVDNPLFGHAINAAPPRLMQLALKYTF